LTADNFDTHAWVTIPLNRVKLDESSFDGLIEIVVLYSRVIQISLKDLLVSVFIGYVLPLKGVSTERDHERRNPFLFARPALSYYSCDLYFN
jgi:hypothetical protein